MQNAQKGNRKGAFFSFFKEPLLLSNLDSPASTLGERENGTIFHQHFVFFLFIRHPSSDHRHHHHHHWRIGLFYFGLLSFFFTLPHTARRLFFCQNPSICFFLVVFPHVPIISWSLLPPFFPTLFYPLPDLPDPLTRIRGWGWKGEERERGEGRGRARARETEISSNEAMYCTKPIIPRNPFCLFSYLFVHRYV